MFFVLGCGSELQYENYSFSAEKDILITKTNHPHGYEKTGCFYCHTKENIHKVNRLNSPMFDLAKQLVETQGLASCKGCHGNNGVNP